MQNLKKTLGIGAVVLVLLYLLLRLVILILMREPDLGISFGELAPCEGNAVCVSSQLEESDSAHYVAPFENTNSVDNAKSRIFMIMKEIKGAQIVDAGDQYLHFEVKVAPFGIINDVEFYFPWDGVPFDVRSSARISILDFNTNRNRVEEIRELYSEE